MHVSEAHYIHATVMHTPSTHCEDQKNSPLQVSELQLETEGSQLAGEWPSEGEVYLSLLRKLISWESQRTVGVQVLSIKHTYECMH